MTDQEDFIQLLWLFFWRLKVIEDIILGVSLRDEFPFLLGPLERMSSVVVFVLSNRVFTDGGKAKIEKEKEKEKEKENEKEREKKEYEK